ncbi:MAG: PadR family transcriptional regulator [Candidatus Nezhaarchaeota archaeon]|nr:PadR family transcriptional regulator [Candidatus Nezhaarchaeota archaeon]
MLNESGIYLPSPLFRRWLKHIAAVPKGFLRYQVLELLSEKPLSGSEIMKEIEKRTNGCWKPSPGSVYPLLAWLQDNGYIREVPAEESGMKRYTLTEEGKRFLEDQRKAYMHFCMSRRHYVSPLLGLLWLRLPLERVEEIRGAFRDLFRALFNLTMSLGERFSEEALKETLKILRETAEKLEEIERGLRGERR